MIRTLKEILINSLHVKEFMDSHPQWSPGHIKNTDYLISESLKRLQLTLDKNFPQIQAAQLIRYYLTTCSNLGKCSRPPTQD